jgi:HEAT repeat protein
MHELRLRVLILAAVTALASLALAVRASGQISLPPKKETKGNVAPYLVCTICGERNYTSFHDGRRDKEGNEIAWCNKCKRDTAQRSSQSAPADEKKRGNLHLPPTAPPTSGATPDSPGSPDSPDLPGARATAPQHDKAAETADAVPPENTSARVTGAAAFIFGEVRKAQTIDDRIALKAVDSLLALGDPGLVAARASLADSEPAVIMTAARVLLRSGGGDDVELVKNRARGKLPPSVGVPIVDELVRADPVRVTPRYLCELLDSPHAGVRLAAERNLRAQKTPELLALLEPLLSSKRAETRLAALSLAADVDDPSVADILLAHVADTSPKVASTAVSALAGRKDADLDAKLVALAFKGRWILRENAYALVAIVEREDLMLKPILDETETEPLLTALQSNDPFVSGACASALAGIGFRSPHTKSTAWLDQAVMNRLIFTVSGKQFFNDFSALSEPALRRLRLLTGQEFGRDGPRWVDWWLGAREGFFARRACIETDPSDAARISVRFQTRGADAQSYALVGPSLAGGADTGRVSSDLYYLTANEARDLMAVMEREGVFGPDRLPGARGARGSDERTLEVAVAGRGKTFVFGSNATEPWFERCVSAVRALRERNEWQRYPDPKKNANTFALWQEQSEWWAAEHAPRERALRLKGLVFAVLPSARASVRDAGIDELVHLYVEQHAAEAGDFSPLVALISEEAIYSQRTHKLVRLALEAARQVEASSTIASTSGAPTAPLARDGANAADAALAGANANVDASANARAAAMPASAARVPRELARDLVEVLHQKFHNAAATDLTEVACACGNAFARELAHDERPLLRAVAAVSLSQLAAPQTANGALPQSANGALPSAASVSDAKPDDADLAVLMKLLDDKDREVEVAAIAALGEHHVDAARTELLVRARLGLPAVRVAALEAVGKLGGPLVLDALVVGASDAELDVRVAAAKGLAALADPASTQLLISMLSEGRDAAVFDPVRAALVKIGAPAWPDLMRVARAPGNHARREAAILLSQQGVPEAASALMTMLTTTPNDPEIARELAVLTCVDFRAQPDAASAWWSWWDGVVHDDSLAWFLGALERGGLAPPARNAFEGGGTPQGRACLVAIMTRPETNLVERARRELSRMLGRDLGEMPPRGSARDMWLFALRESLQHKREQ